MRRTPFAVAAVAALALAHPASAAAKPLVVTDLAGDANGVNSQSLGLPLPATSTSAASVKGADIQSLTLTNLFKGKGKTAKPAGFTVALKLNGAVQQGVNFIVTMESSSPCGGSSTIQLGFQNAPVLTTNLAICQSADTGEAGTTIGSTAVDAANGVITWTIDGAVLPKGAQLSDIQAGATVFVLGVFDELTTDKTFTYGV